MELEKPTGPATQHGGQQRMRRVADEKPPEAADVEMGAEDPCEAQVKRAKTIMDLAVCVLEAQDDVYDETPGTPTNSAENSAGTRQTKTSWQELNRVKTLGRAGS